MPEMPEVENIVVGIKDFIENKKIVDVEIIKGDIIKISDIRLKKRGIYNGRKIQKCFYAG